MNKSCNCYSKKNRAFKRHSFIKPKTMSEKGKLSRGNNEFCENEKPSSPMS